MRGALAQLVLQGLEASKMEYFIFVPAYEGFVSGKPRPVVQRTVGVEALRREQGLKSPKTLRMAPSVVLPANVHKSAHHMQCVIEESHDGPIGEAGFG